MRLRLCRILSLGCLVPAGMIAADEPATPVPTATPPPAGTIVGTGTFFDGRVSAEVTLGHMRRPGGPRTQSGADGKESERPWRGGSGGGGEGGRRHRGGGDGPPPEMRGGDGDDESPAMRLRHGGGGNNPPLMLHLSLTNHSAEPMTVTVHDFNSPLGNFVVEPETMTLPPGATVAAEPMTSRLGRAPIELTVKVRLSTGDRSDTQDVILHRPEPGAAAGAAQAPKS